MSLTELDLPRTTPRLRHNHDFDPSCQEHDGIGECIPRAQAQITETYTAALHAFSDVHHERRRQDLKWGEQNHDLFKWAAILGEEYGELCQAILRTHFGKVDPEYIREECVQVAAVAVAMLECMERNGYVTK